MSFRKKMKNLTKTNDERTYKATGTSASITLIIGLGIFLIEMLVKVLVTNDLRSITWEAVLFLVMIVIFVIILLLNNKPMKK